ncbi:MAG: HNH endonuclease family protein, partial [Dehalococcoidia bacterium]
RTRSDSHNEWTKDRGQVTIGNLTYSGYNTEMGNLSFDAKKNILEQSNFELNKRIVHEANWTESRIEERSKEMADRALAIWKRT